MLARCLPLPKVRRGLVPDLAIFVTPNILHYRD